MIAFFSSLKTTVWSLLVLICLFFIGAYMMPAHREVFAPMNDDILLHWVAGVAAGNLWYTWWFFAALAALMLLTMNTLVCSVQAVRGRWSRTDFLLRISPQIVHLGFLFILLAHVLGAGWGYKLSGMLPEGMYAQLPGDKALYLKDIRVETNTRGHMTDWAAEAYLFENNVRVMSGTLGPNKPLFHNGVGIYIKSLNLEQGPAAYLVIARDPGAIWALVGGMLFIIGLLMLLVLKWKKA
ncbi:MAG: cytochrome c biogenesis protein ResB [Nitrospirota bacterium]